MEDAEMAVAASTPQNQRLNDFQKFFLNQLKSACSNASKSLPLQGLDPEDVQQWKYLTKQVIPQIISQTEQEIDVIAKERDLSNKLNDLDQALAAAGIQFPPSSSSTSGWKMVAERALRAQMLQSKKQLLDKERELLEALTAREEELKTAFIGAAPSGQQ